MAQRTGAEIVLVPDDERGQLDVDALEARLDDRTRVVNVVHMPTSGGLVNPAEEVGRVLADSDALFILDATQTVGQLPIDVTRIGCDLLTGTGRKFLRGPRGTGFLWVSDAALDQLEPYVAEIRSATWDGARGFNWAPAARRFETWENSYANLIGLGTAVQQALDIGLDAIAEAREPLPNTSAAPWTCCPASPPTTSAPGSGRSSLPSSTASTADTRPPHSARRTST
jgi:selenocysteine lyase/cysteine desulfurase